MHYRNRFKFEDITDFQSELNADIFYILKINGFSINDLISCRYMPMRVNRKFRKPNA
jgi:hypothetical protein